MDRLTEWEGFKKLACAVILQWMEDYEELILQKRKTEKEMLPEEKITYNWLETEWCDFRCSIAGIDKYHLKRWKEKVDKWAKERKSYLTLNLPRKNIIKGGVLWQLKSKLTISE